MTPEMFLITYNITIICVVLSFLGPILFLLFSIYLKRKNDAESARYYTELRKNIEEGRMNTIQAELDVKKLKFARRRCQYCSSLNTLDKVNCVNCGGVLKEINDETRR